MSLQEYENIIGSSAGFCTILQILSPVFLCVNFIKQGSTKNVEISPFIGNLVLSILFVQNDILIKNRMLFIVDITSVFLSLMYLTLYIFYTKNKEKLYPNLRNAVLFLGALIIYVQKEDKDMVQYRFGLIVTIFLMIVIASPLFSVKKILRTKNTNTLPMPLIISGSVVSFLWLLYGIIINEFIIKIQNSIALFLNLSQLILYVYCKLKKKRNAGLKKID